MNVLRENARQYATTQSYTILSVEKSHAIEVVVLRNSNLECIQKLEAYYPTERFGSLAPAQVNYHSSSSNGVDAEAVQAIALAFQMAANEASVANAREGV